MLSPFRAIWAQLTNPMFASAAIRVALIVGSILFGINHGVALVQGTMTRDRWLSALLTYCVPYCVNIYGQYLSYSRISAALDLSQSNPAQPPDRSTLQAPDPQN